MADDAEDVSLVGTENEVDVLGKNRTGVNRIRAFLDRLSKTIGHGQGVFACEENFWIHQGSLGCFAKCAIVRYVGD